MPWPPLPHHNLFLSTKCFKMKTLYHVIMTMTFLKSKWEGHTRPVLPLTQFPFSPTRALHRGDTEQKGAVIYGYFLEIII